ncbi:MAG: hypothetical protein K2P35_06730 [Lachnospiraceae bacterium]|nr:hypothetical protein [Lachnospiraceae bacterium]
MNNMITCVYYCDCKYCMYYDNDFFICNSSGSVVIDEFAPCPDFKCGIPFEYCSGDCDR